MKKLYTTARLLAAKVRKFCKMKIEQINEMWREFRKLDGKIAEQMVEILDRPTPSERVVVSFLQTTSTAQRFKVHRFIDTMKRLGCIVETEDSDLQSANGNTYAIASMYIDGAVVWKIRLGRSVEQNEVSKIIL